MKPGKKVLYDVTCSSGHVFPKAFEIEDGTEDLLIQQVEAYCPMCDEMLLVTVKGKAMPDTFLQRYAVKHGRLR